MKGRVFCNLALILMIQSQLFFFSRNEDKTCLVLVPIISLSPGLSLNVGMAFSHRVTRLKLAL